VARTHEAVLRKEDGAWLVEFPGLPGCHTFGEALDEARANAREALQGLAGRRRGRGTHRAEVGSGG